MRAANPDNAETQVVEAGYLSLDSFEDSQLEVRKQGPLPEQAISEMRGDRSKHKGGEDSSSRVLKKGRAFTESRFQAPEEKEEDQSKEEEDSKDEEATKYYEKHEKQEEEEKHNHEVKTETPKDNEHAGKVDEEDDAIQSNEEEQVKRGTFQEHCTALCCLVLSRYRYLYISTNIYQSNDQSNYAIYSALYICKTSYCRTEKLWVLSQLKFLPLLLNVLKQNAMSFGRAATKIFSRQDLAEPSLCWYGHWNVS